MYFFTGLYSKESAEHVQQLLQKNEVPPNLFELYVEEIFSYLRGNIFKRFIESDKFTRKVSWSKLIAKLKWVVNMHFWLLFRSGRPSPSPDSSCKFKLFSRIKTPFRITSPGKHIVNEDQTLPLVDVPWLILLSLQRDVDKRLGCGGQGAEELKNHPFFTGVDWVQVYQQKYPPPLIPPRGEVNAADAFDIGSFDEEDTKGLKLTEADQELYKNFPLVISERWQNEVSDKVI